MYFWSNKFRKLTYNHVKYNFLCCIKNTTQLCGQDTDPESVIWVLHWIYNPWLGDLQKADQRLQPSMSHHANKPSLFLPKGHSSSHAGDLTL